MYFDRLRQRVHSAVGTRNAAATRSPVTDHIADCYLPIHQDIVAGKHSVYHLPGGRGSGKSSFVALEIINGIMEDPDANGIVFRRYANTLRESTFAQLQWAIDELGVYSLWRANVSPMAYTYIPTGQQILFRGLDDAGKLKSIKPRRGRFAWIWFEEFSELNGTNQVRSVLQSVVRGGDGFRIFNSFNPPISRANWANKYILTPDDRALLFRTDYRMIPPEWLGESFLLEAERLAEINEKAYRHEYLGEAVGSGGEVFPNLEAREITDDEIQQMQYFYAGLDFGFSVDPFCYVLVSYDSKRQTLYLLDEVYKRGCTNSMIAAEIRERNTTTATAPAPAPRRTGEPGVYASTVPTLYTYNKASFVICDCAEPKSIQDLRTLGVKAIPCTKYPGCVEYRIRWLQGKRLIIDPKRTPNAYKEFSEYEYVTTKDGEFLATVPDKNNHAIDAVSYALDRLINNRHYSA